MKLPYIKFFILVLSSIFIFLGAFRVYASVGTIDPSYHTAQVCENAACTVTSTSPVNFGYFTTASSSNVEISDTELTGYIWGKSFGYVVLNCTNTSGGCTTANGQFKVSNNTSGHLSGFGWGDTAGWINFGPFSNSATAPITINSSGEFSGYAWAQNFGWIKFDCGNASYCVKTDWRPQTTSNPDGGGPRGSNPRCLNPSATNYNANGFCVFPSTIPLPPMPTTPPPSFTVTTSPKGNNPSVTGSEAKKSGSYPSPRYTDIPGENSEYGSTGVGKSARVPASGILTDFIHKHQTPILIVVFILLLYMIVRLIKNLLR